MMAEDRTMLQITDYVVIVVMLLVPLGIGVFFAIRDSKKATRDVYLLGGKNMSALPVTLSIFVTFTSAISLMGIPSDVYANGPMFFGFYVGIACSFAIAYFTLTPLMYPLCLTSVYEYLEMRFDSTFVRYLSTVMGMLQTFFYMAISLLAPGLALEAAAGVPLWISVVIVGATATAYTAAGGLKSVVWTDAFQSLVVLIGLFAVIIRVCYDIGGVDKMFNIASDGGRTSFAYFSPDPRCRHTWWGVVIGGALTWLTNLFSQSTVQRISSLKSMKDARRVMLINIPINICYGFIIIVFGWTTYSYFFHIRCDPLKGGFITNPNQMAPYFVLHSMHELSGFAGLYMSSLFCGALSTVSSGINALAANTVEDILKKPLSSVSEKKATTITKIAALLYGTAIIVVVYLAKSVKGQITQMSISVFGTFGGAVFAMFLQGCSIPWANKYGAVTSGISAMVVNMWLVVGNRLYGKRAKGLDPVPTDGCTNSTTSPILIMTIINNSTEHSPINVEITSNDSYEGFSFYDISYEWYIVIGVIVSLIVGLTVSWITRHKVKKEVDPKLILPILRGYWNLPTTSVKGEDSDHYFKEETDLSETPIS